MSIESPIPQESPLQAEENILAEWFAQKQFTGEGFDKLSQALFIRNSAITNSLEEQRPLFLVIDYAEREAALRDTINMLVSEGIGIPRESQLITYLELKELDDQKTEEIINSGVRPLIQPLSIGPGQNPKWWIGPLWKFHSIGNVEAFRRQFEEVQI